MFQPYIARKGEFVGAHIKAGNGNEIVKNVVQPADLPRFGSDRQLLFQHFLVIAVTWAKHHAMVAKNDRHAVTVNRNVPNGKNCHLINAAKLCLSFLHGKTRAVVGMGRHEYSRSL